MHYFHPTQWEKNGDGKFHPRIPTKNQEKTQYSKRTKRAKQQNFANPTFFVKKKHVRRSPSLHEFIISKGVFFRKKQTNMEDCSPLKKSGHLKTQQKIISNPRYYHIVVISVKPEFKGQLGVPLTVYPWYLLCSPGILGDYNP